MVLPLVPTIGIVLLESLTILSCFYHHSLRFIKLNLRRQHLPIILVKAKSLLKPSGFGLVLRVPCVK